jgi:N-acetylmuramoyl-L-alanine amidase
VLAVYRRRHLAVLLLTAAALAGCTTGTTGTATPAQVLTTGTTTTTAPTTSNPPTTTVPTTTTPVGHGQVIVLDPGHDGGNGSHPSEINKLVPAGRGRTKACNTTGTETDAGYPEHAFNWDVARRVRAKLTAAGYHVVLTRHSDTGVGPCVNERARIGNDAHAAAVVSIHADGSTVAGAHGFHVEYSSPPLNAEQGTPSVDLATTLRNTVREHGFATANYLGHSGLFGRDDLGGLNLSDRPTALIECGNMRNPADAAVLDSAGGRQRLAAAIAAGIEAYLRG